MGRGYGRYRGYGGYGGFGPYVTVAEKRAKAKKRIEKLRKKGEKLKPIELTGRKIASTFWGKSWCRNLESYSDYSNRLPRGRSYVRHGAVLHLEMSKGEINALVSGSSPYKICIRITPVKSRQWKKLCAACTGTIGSLIELLNGNLSEGVMEIMTAKGSGLFPTPDEIQMTCSCPDWATMCKHVSAVLYGIGARLDEEPELLFLLRGVDHRDLVSQAVDGGEIGASKTSEKTIDAADLSDVFGIEMVTAPPRTKKVRAKTKPKAPQKTAGRKTPAKGKKKPLAGRKKLVVMKKPVGKKKPPKGKTKKSTGKTPPVSGRKPRPPNLQSKNELHPPKKADGPPINGAQICETGFI